MYPLGQPFTAGCDWCGRKNAGKITGPAFHLELGTWGCSSAGRARRSQRRGHRFDPGQLHHIFSHVQNRLAQSCYTKPRRSLFANTLSLPGIEIRVILNEPTPVVLSCHRGLPHGPCNFLPWKLVRIVDQLKSHPAVGFGVHIYSSAFPVLGVPRRSL